MYTYANQKIIHINKKKYGREFLQIGIEEWVNAYKKLSASAFAVYLYLAGNTDGFDLALSQKAVFNKLGISKATYHRAVNELEENGYIKLKQGNIYEYDTVGFMEETKVDKRQDKTNDSNKKVSSVRQDSLSNDTNESHGQDKVVSSVSTQINKKDKKDKIYNIESERSSSSDAATQQAKETLYKLSELVNIHDNYKLNKFLSYVGVGASEAVAFLEEHEEYTWKEWFVNDLDHCFGDNSAYEEFFVEGYKKICKSDVE